MDGTKSEQFHPERTPIRKEGIMALATTVIQALGYIDLLREAQKYAKGNGPLSGVSDIIRLESTKIIDSIAARMITVDPRDARTLIIQALYGIFPDSNSPRDPFAPLIAFTISQPSQTTVQNTLNPTAGNRESAMNPIYRIDKTATNNLAQTIIRNSGFITTADTKGGYRHKGNPQLKLNLTPGPFKPKSSDPKAYEIRIEIGMK